MSARKDIRIGINVWVWEAPFTDNSLGVLAKVKEMGFDTAEFPLEQVSYLSAEKVNEALKGTGLTPVTCGVFGPDRDLTNDDPKVRKACLDYVRTALKFSEAIGSKLIIGPMYAAVGKRRHIPADQKKIEWDRAVSGLQKAGKMAADHGVTIALEPLNRFETDLINMSDQCVRLVNDIGMKSVGVHLDTFHMNIEEKSIYEAVKTAGKKLVHVHACENDRGAPGSGQVDWKGLAKGLKEIGYDGNVVIESFTPECTALAAATCIWHPLAPTQDDLAKSGLKFLRKLLK
jgi:D-psicose/D-tagatose/L-ribulose 3-epimerase